MDIVRYPLGQLQANCYILIQEKDCIIIDPADSADFILEETQRRNLTVKALLATHGHFDHVMAAGEIQLSFPKVPLYIHSADLFLIKRLKETAKYFLDHEPYVLQPTLIEPIQERIWVVGGFQFQVLHTPGHTPGSCCFYFSDDKMLVSGDTLFAGSVGRYDFAYSDKKALRQSVSTICKLDGDVIVYPGHGDETRIDIERQRAATYFSF